MPSGKSSTIALRTRALRRLLACPVIAVGPLRPDALPGSVLIPLPSAPPVSERRISSRHYYHGAIAVRLQNGHAFVAYGIDVSASGIAFRCDENLVPDTRCDLHFSLPFASGVNHRFTLQGVVVYTSLAGGGDGFKVAVHFHGQSAQARELLAAYALQLD